MNKRGWNAAAWVFQLSVGIALLAFLLSKLGPSLRHFLLLGIFSAGVLLLIEAALLHGWIKELQSQPQKSHDENSPLKKEQPSEGPGPPIKQSEPDDLRKTLLRRRNWFLRVGVSLTLTPAAFISSVCCPSPRPPGNSQSIVRFSDQVEKALTDYLGSASALRGPGPPTNGVMKLDPGLEGALRQHLQNQNPPAAAGAPSWVILVLIGLALGALVWVIWWSLDHKPEATPLTIAIATLTAVSGVIEKLVGKGQIPAFRDVPWLVVIIAGLLFLVGIVLLSRGCLCLFRLRPWEKTDVTKEGALLGAALLVFGFSAALLALVPPLLFPGKEPAPKPCPQCPAPEVIWQQKKIRLFSFNGIDNLGGRPEDKNLGRKKIQQLTGDLAKSSAQAGDILLLFGSADCIPTRPKNKGGHWDSNEELANARASWVKDSLQGQPAVSDIKIETLPLPQHARCGLASNVRAVYPFLIHGESN